MATFPEDPKPVYPLVVTPVWNTIISQTGTGKEQRLQKSLFAVYDVTVKYYGLSSADAKTLWEFYMARKGAFEAFYIYDLALLAGVSFVHTGMYAGVGDGADGVCLIFREEAHPARPYILTGTSRARPRITVY